MPLFKITTRPGIRSFSHKMRSANAKRQSNMRDMMREQGRALVEISRQEAPEGRTGRFRKGIIFRTTDKGDNIILNVYHPEPLGTWITKGTRPHIIRAKNVRFLHFEWPGGGDAGRAADGTYYFRSVNHPGTKANPYHVRAMARWRPQAIVALRKIGQQFVIDFTR